MERRSGLSDDPACAVADAFPGIPPPLDLRDLPDLSILLRENACMPETSSQASAEVTPARSYITVECRGERYRFRVRPEATALEVIEQCVPVANPGLALQYVVVPGKELHTVGPRQLVMDLVDMGVKSFTLEDSARITEPYVKVQLMHEQSWPDFLFSVDQLVHKQDNVIQLIAPPTRRGIHLHVFTSNGAELEPSTTSNEKGWTFKTMDPPKQWTPTCLQYDFVCRFYVDIRAVKEKTQGLPPQRFSIAACCLTDQGTCNDEKRAWSQFTLRSAPRGTKRTRVESKQEQKSSALAVVVPSRSFGPGRC